MIKFYEKRNIFFVLSITLMLIGVIALFVNGMDLSIQFKGGAILKYTYVGELDAEKVAGVASQTLGGRNTNAQITTDLMTKTSKVVLNLAGEEGLSAQEQETLDAALKAAFGSNELALSESNMVQPFIGRRFLQNSLLALALAFFLIIIYVWYRFRRISGLSAGVTAVIALVHDVAIVFFTFILFKIPIDESFIAVSLTIIGFSMNDTIVIYDRIRENANMHKKLSTPELVNQSINQSLMRSINTSVATTISMLIVYIFAVIYNIQSIQIFAFPLIMGMISGVYSTIFIAGPLWAMWQIRKEKANA